MKEVYGPGGKPKSNFPKSLVELKLSPKEVTVKALRYNEGKPKLSYMLDFPRAMEGVCRVAAFGAEKYSRDNWKKGLDESALYDSLMRHLVAAKQEGPHAVDEESGLAHLFHAAWNVLVLCEQHVRK